uniref:Uncharacterized protein n=1 Tax=Romanomermis culicivorax TaxID=13658 RepID=A0A915HSG2_ROMCU
YARPTEDGQIDDDKTTPSSDILQEPPRPTNLDAHDDSLASDLVDHLSKAYLLGVAHSMVESLHSKAVSIERDVEDLIRKMDQITAIVNELEDRSTTGSVENVPPTTPDPFESTTNS